MEVFVDATGLGIVGQGEWAAARWGQRGRRGWKKLHIAVDASGYILAAEVTDSAVADSAVFEDLLRDIRAPIERITADGGYTTDSCTPPRAREERAQSSHRVQAPFGAALLPLQTHLWKPPPLTTRRHPTRRGSDRIPHPESDD